MIARPQYASRSLSRAPGFADVPEDLGERTGAVGHTGEELATAMGDRRQFAASTAQ
ncbi:hypothetical protein ACGFSD_08270 [Streptomyces caniferus]|uniref:hypothetical protein n=1 Tax=Streptomyces caniferus TaxID=285557 RepID=UPI00340C41C2